MEGDLFSYIHDGGGSIIGTLLKVGDNVPKSGAFLELFFQIVTPTGMRFGISAGFFGVRYCYFTLKKRPLM